jgi:hypothetical protein
MENIVPDVFEPMETASTMPSILEEEEVEVEEEQASGEDTCRVPDVMSTRDTHGADCVVPTMPGDSPPPKALAHAGEKRRALFPHTPLVKVSKRLSNLGAGSRPEEVDDLQSLLNVVKLRRGS